MSKLVLQKHNGGLVAADEASEAWIWKISDGEKVMCEVRKPRNINHHRKFFALLNKVCDNLDQPVTVEMLLGLIKLRTGHCDLIDTVKGTVAVPRSIAFENMDQTEFDAFWNRAVDFIMAEVIPGVDRDALEREVLEMIN